MVKVINQNRVFRLTVSLNQSVVRLFLFQTVQSCQQENVVKLLSATNLQPSQLDLSQIDCPALNISQCEVSESAGTFLVLVYNPLSRPVTHHVRLPVPSTKYEVYDHRGEKIPTQFNEIPAFIRNIPGDDNYYLPFVI